MGPADEHIAAAAPVPSAPAVSSSLEADDNDFVDDLRDVFRILYDDDDDKSEDESEDGRAGEGGDAEADETAKHPPMHEQAPTLDLPELPSASTAGQGKKRASVARMTTRRAERALAWLASSVHGGNAAREEQQPAAKKRRRNVQAPIAGSSNSADPLSVTAYHSRLVTFGAPTFTPKRPPTLNAANIARYGWSHAVDEDECLACATCGARWSLKGVGEALEGRGFKAGPKLSEELRQKLVRLLTERLADAHREACVWRTHQSPTSISQWLLARHPQSSIHLSAVAMHVQRRSFEPPSEGEAKRPALTVKHPLSPQQVSCLVDNMQRGRALHLQWADDTAEQHVKLPVISEPAAALAMFGWSPYVQHTEEVLHCELCDRKIGLWLFRGTRPLDVMAEHRDFCPIRRESTRGEAAWWMGSPLLSDAGKGKGQQDVKTYQAERVAHARAILKQLTQTR